MAEDLDFLERYVQYTSLLSHSLGFSLPQQAIHPTQVEIIQSTFVPTDQGKLPKTCFVSYFMIMMIFIAFAEILRAAKILHGMQAAHASQKGAIGLEGEMIDAPMIKQVSFVSSIPSHLSTLSAHADTYNFAFASESRSFA